MNYQHPAHTIPFNELYEGLEREVVEGNIRKVLGPEGLVLYNYTDQCTFAKHWNVFTESARGLVLAPHLKKIAATTFNKFWNLSEHEYKVPISSFTTFEKVDGSLIICFEHEGAWYCATRGSFNSEQSIFANSVISRNNLTQYFQKGHTYLMEAIYPENRIVVDYKGWTGLVFLSSFSPEGIEDLNPFEGQDDYLLRNTYKEFRFVQTHRYSSIEQISELAKQLDHNSEGFVVRFDNGFRVKIKSDDYVRVHKLRFNMTPLAIWELLRNGKDPEEYKRELPEEFWPELDNIVSELRIQKHKIYIKHVFAFSDYECLARKDFALKVLADKTLHPHLMFSLYDNISDTKLYEMIYDLIRPTANVIKEST